MVSVQSHASHARSLYTLDTLCADLAAIAADHAGRAGATPFPRYLFLLMLSHDAYGGLEHRASSVNLAPPIPPAASVW